LIRALDDPATPRLLAPLDRAVADALESVSRREVPDLPDPDDRVGIDRDGGL